MYSKFRLALKYLKYYITASNGKGHGMHSPFVFHFITKVLNDDQSYPAYDKVEGLRKQLQLDTTDLTIKDLGAGSANNNSSKRTISSIAKNSAKPKKYGQLLFRIVKAYQLKTIIELGTSLGITTSYLSLAKVDAVITTIEGANEVAAVAAKNFEKLALQNVNIIKGNFDETLSDVVNQHLLIDFAFIDGNHRQTPTERYFLELLSKANNETIMVFDDIHWSKEMEAAWETIKNHPDVRCTIDLFFIGIVLFRKEFKAKQHFTIRF